MVFAVLLFAGITAMGQEKAEPTEKANTVYVTVNLSAAEAFDRLFETLEDEGYEIEDTIESRFRLRTELRRLGAGEIALRVGVVERDEEVQIRFRGRVSLLEYPTRELRERFELENRRNKRSPVGQGFREMERLARMFGDDITYERK